MDPSSSPSNSPSDAPSDVPSTDPPDSPSNSPSDAPSDVPSTDPSDSPSNSPSGGPSEAPSMDPSKSPSDSPSGGPSNAPSMVPSSSPSDSPSDQPSVLPSFLPSMVPSFVPSISQEPSIQPSREDDCVFQIRTSLPSYDTSGNTTWCLTVDSPLLIGQTSKVVVRRCNLPGMMQKQLFSTNEYGQIYMVGDKEPRCLTTYSRKIYMDACVNGGEAQQAFAVKNENVTDATLAKNNIVYGNHSMIEQSKNGNLWEIGIERDREFSRVRLFKCGNSNPSITVWYQVCGWGPERYLLGTYGIRAKCDSSYDRWPYNVLENAKLGLDPPNYNIDRACGGGQGGPGFGGGGDDDEGR